MSGAQVQCDYTVRSSNQDTFFSFVEVWVTVSGKLESHEQRAIDIETSIWEFTGSGIVFAAGDVENRIPVLFQQLRFDDDRQGYPFLISNPFCEPLVLNRELIKLVLFSLPTRSVSGQTCSLNPPTSMFPPAVKKVSTPMVLQLSSSHVFIRAKFTAVPWYTCGQIGLAADPQWRFCPVSVTNVPSGLARIQEHMVRSMDSYGPVAEKDDTHFSVFKIAYVDNTLFMILACIPRSCADTVNLSSSFSLLFSGVFNRHLQPITDLHKPNMSVAFNTTSESLRNGYVPIIDPNSHVNQFSTPTRDTLGLFMPDCTSDALAVYYCSTWSSHKIFTPKVDPAREGHETGARVGNLVSRCKRLKWAEVGRMFFMCRERVTIKIRELSATPEEVRALVSGTHIYLHPLGILVRLDNLNPICVNVVPQTGLKAMSKTRTELKNMSQHFTNLYLEEIRLLNGFLESENRSAVEQLVLASKFPKDGPWRPWPLCDKHHYRQIIKMEVTL
ncbi:protein EE29 [Proboscivirus elephantidbeta5]|uniref:Protein EE29 n=1 Tax=Elephant endotheliotropic herpesvirus 5 TaxID=768738 RepID=A0A075CZK6_9BETA|nr:protein EE29 [Elephant endotheliotropic herpesvirus 5]AHC02823.1 protein EE29 [Elephant endotheliotropic herpesvirus 5]